MYWKIIYEHPFYYIVNTVSGEKIKVPPETEQEIKEKRYQRYYDKAYVTCEKANGHTVYLNRHINGKVVVYKYTPKGIKK